MKLSLLGNPLTMPKRYFEIVGLLNFVPALNPFRERISEQFLKLENYHRAFELTAKHFDVTSFKREYEEKSYELNGKVLNIKKLKEDYVQAPENVRANVLAQFEAAIEQFTVGVEAMDDLLGRITMAAWIDYYLQFRRALGKAAYDQMWQKLIAIKDSNTEDRAKWLQDSCRLLVSHPNLVNRLNPFLEGGFRVQYIREKCVSIHYPCGKIQIYSF